MRVTNPAANERLLLYICNETRELRRQLNALTGELGSEEVARLEGALSHIESQSTALLFSLPPRTAVQ
jgi:hypothetical protein